MSAADSVIWLATTNPAKAERMAWLLAGLPLEHRSLVAGPPIEPPEESGDSYAANAVIKAVYYSARLPGLVLASDGGAEIPVLGDRWRGIHTGRAAGEVDDEAKLRHVLALLEPYHGEERQAFWNETAALGRDGHVLACWSVVSRPGYLARNYDPSRLLRGFWLANLWTYSDRGKTHVELLAEDPEHVAGHWGELRDKIQAYFRSPDSPAGIQAETRTGP